MLWLGVALAVSSCSAAPTAPAPDRASPAAATSPVAVPSPATTPTSPRATPSRTPTPSVAAKPAPSKPSPDTRTGRQLAKPYAVKGIIVVSKKHRISAAYAPVKPTGPYRLTSATWAALAKMTAAARADGVRIRVHSGYRNWASQNASYQRAKRNYPQNLSFYAPAGASEHQTGLAVDLWDGVTWSLPMANTATGKWLFKHAHEYGFILRYPEGKTKITGYHYEPWHYRFIGRTDAMKFKNNSLTLEEYLGLT